MGWQHKIENQAMLPSTTSVYRDIGYITEDEEDELLLVSTTPNNKSKGRRRQSRGSYHKRDSLQSISCGIADDDSISDDDINSPTANRASS